MSIELTNDFEKTKEVYRKCRKDERSKIIAYLQKEGFLILKPRGGSGRANYTSGKRLKKAYDLSNWKWIEVSYKDIFFCIMLQAFDRDPGTGNRHMLEDRIGIYAYRKYNAEEAFTKMIITDIDLPMDESKLSELEMILKGWAYTEDDVAKITDSIKKNSTLTENEKEELIHIIKFHFSEDV